MSRPFRIAWELSVLAFALMAYGVGPALCVVAVILDLRWTGPGDAS